MQEMLPNSEDQITTTGQLSHIETRVDILNSKESDISEFNLSSMQNVIQNLPDDARGSDSSLSPY